MNLLDIAGCMRYVVCDDFVLWRKKMRKIIYSDNLEYLKTCSDEYFDLIYIDPPFNTGKIRDGSKLYNNMSYNDKFDDFMSFIKPRMEEAYRVLKKSGSLFFHIDYREVHYCKIELDKIFGRECFMNEIIWSYDYGGRSKKRWSPKHDNILWYVKDSKNYTFNYDSIDRIPYMAPKLVGPEKAEKGKVPTDVWWHTIVHTTGKERTGYPTQKPLGIINRIVKAHSDEGDLLLDFFAGSGTLGESAAINNRSCILVDKNEEAIKVMKERLEKYGFQE